MKTAAFKTLGCKVNQYETQLIREQFLNAGFKEVSPRLPADVYVINTCTVTQKTDAESRRIIKAARRTNPSCRIVVTGCYTELDEEEIKRLDDRLIIIKNSQKSKILRHLLSPSAITQATPQGCTPQGCTPLGCKEVINAFEGRTKAFVKVQDGCDNFCSYCKVPLVRGTSRSRPPDEVISEISQLVANGYKEIVLTGICLGNWGKELNLALSHLLNEIRGRVEGTFRIRLSSIEPWYVTDELIETIARTKNICRHLHIPMQSGDDAVLKKMNRNFTSKAFVDLINKLRLRMPGVAFTTDIVVGFPGEEAGHFNNTLRLVETAKPSRMHIFPFSRRKGTKAYFFKEIVPGYVVADRIKRLKSIGGRLALGYQRQCTGQPVEVLVETKRDKQTGLLVGYTDTYIKVGFEGPDELKGTLQLAGVLPLTNQNSCDILVAHLLH